jgi:hypothetical protein
MPRREPDAGERRGILAVSGEASLLDAVAEGVSAAVLSGCNALQADCRIVRH